MTKDSSFATYHDKQFYKMSNLSDSTFLFNMVASFVFVIVTLVLGLFRLIPTKLFYYFLDLSFCYILFDFALVVMDPFGITDFAYFVDKLDNDIDAGVWLISSCGFLIPNSFLVVDLAMSSDTGYNDWSLFGYPVLVFNGFMAILFLISTCLLVNQVKQAWEDEVKSNYDKLVKDEKRDKKDNNKASLLKFLSQLKLLTVSELLRLRK